MGERFYRANEKKPRESGIAKTKRRLKKFNIVGPTFLENLTPEQLRIRVDDTERRFGVGLEFLRDLVNCPHYTAILLSHGVFKDYPRPFRLVLNHRQSVLTKLAPSYPEIQIRDNPLDDPLFAEYFNRIRRYGGQSTLNDYLRGEWNDEIENAVMRAQKDVLIPQAYKTKIEQKPRVSFKIKEDWMNGKGKHL